MDVDILHMLMSVTADASDFEYHHGGSQDSVLWPSLLQPAYVQGLELPATNHMYMPSEEALQQTIDDPGFLRLVHPQGEIDSERPAKVPITRWKAPPRKSFGRLSFPCSQPGCQRVFTRSTDQARHTKDKHLGIRYKCPLPGCLGPNLKRRDKFRQHCKARHRHVSDEQIDQYRDRLVEVR